MLSTCFAILDRLACVSAATRAPQQIPSCSMIWQQKTIDSLTKPSESRRRAQVDERALIRFA
jgi:hypothetical protein